MFININDCKDHTRLMSKNNTLSTGIVQKS